MRRFLASLSIAASVLLAAPALADDAPAKEAKNDIQLPPMSPDRTVAEQVQLGGRVVRYNATVGHIDIRDAKGKVIGQVVYTAYTVPGAGRPVTFAFNGGPGAASVFLNMGAIGPKHVAFGAQGDSPSDSAVLRDNPATWLDFTDLVFIDPVGTGFSRSLVDADETKKDFYGSKPDIEYLSRVVYDWLTKNGRMTSRKYLVGESYGGYRVPRLGYYLQSQMGVGVSGLVMVSPYLDPPAIGNETNLSPLPWMINLPSMAAGNYEREGRPLNAATMSDVENYVRTDFVTDFLKGTSDKAATDRISARVASYTGLDPALVRRLDGRVDIATYLREIRRNTGQVGSVYDSNVTAYDPFPASADANYNDPLLDGIIAPTTSAAVDFITNQVGWKTDAHYETLSYTVNKAWDRDRTDAPVTDLRKAIANDPKMAVMIVHGWDDLSCPYFTSKLVIDQMPSFGQAQRIKLHVYPGGHMFYARPDSAQAFKRDAMEIYGAR
jgi:carboxypeptidase C (cathepsin A)